MRVHHQSIGQFVPGYWTVPQNPITGGMGRLGDTASDQAFLTNLYQTDFNRAPDPGGLQFWMGQLASGVSQATVAQDFLNSPEYAKDHTAVSPSPVATPSAPFSIFGITLSTPVIIGVAGVGVVLMLMMGKKK